MTDKQVLSEQQVQQYYREGYIVAEGLIPAERVAEVRKVAETTKLSGDGKWTPRIFDHDEPTKDAGLHSLLVEPNVVSAVETIFEAPARVFYGMLAVVPANGGSGLKWHQDNQYTQVLGKALNVFIALCDITPDKAILWVAPGTHRLGTQPSTTEEGHREAAAPDNGMPLPTMKAGDVCIFDRNTLHRSLTNETDENRYAYAAQFLEDTARLADTGAKDPKRMLTAELAEMLKPVKA